MIIYSLFCKRNYHDTQRWGLQGTEKCKAMQRANIVNEFNMDKWKTI